MREIRRRLIRGGGDRRLVSSLYRSTELESESKVPTRVVRAEGLQRVTLVSHERLISRRKDSEQREQ